MPIRNPHRFAFAATSFMALTLALGACTGTSGEPNSGATEPGANTAPAASEDAKKLTLVTHDSFTLPADLLERFTTETGITVETVAPGDGSELVNQLILTKSAPLGDVVYGVDNTFASRAIAENVFEQYTPPNLPVNAQGLLVDKGTQLTPIDTGSVCFNIQSSYFAEHQLPEPETFDDLLKPEYRDLVVVPSPQTSSTGLAFLLATIADKGEGGWQQYWQSLKDNGLKVVADWTTAYYTDFAGASGQGAYPIVLSYSSSPPAEVTDDGQATTRALLDTCFQQVEYAGVLAGGKNVPGAQMFIQFLLSTPVQSALPENMYVYPINPDATLPPDWVSLAPAPLYPFKLPPQAISTGREEWLQQWSDLME